MAYKLETLRKISYEGEVTKVNYSLCYFQMDGSIDVYAGEFAKRHDEKPIPLINETVILKNVLLYDRTTFILTGKSKIINSYNKNESLLELMSDFKSFLLEYNLMPVEYIRIKSMYDNLIDLQVEIIKDNVQYSQINITSLLLDLLRDILANTSENEVSSLSDMTTKLPSTFESNKEVKELQIPPHIYWCMGIYRSSPNEMLIGILNISNKSGFLMISDVAFELPVVIAQNDRNFSSNIVNLLNRFVVIHNYIQITENFKDVGSIKYIYADIDDINTIDIAKESMISNATKNVFKMKNTYLFKIKMFVINKSSITQKERRKYFFIHAKYKIDLGTDAKNAVLQECIFRVTEELLHLYPVFNEKDTYSIYTNCKKFERSISIQEGETIFTIFNIRLQSYNLPVDLKLKLIKDEEEQLTINDEEKLYIYSVEEAKDFLKSTKKEPNRTLIHIEGIVAHRRFFRPLKKKTSKEVKFESFGIPGNMVHNITLRNILKSECEEIVEPCEYVIYENDEHYEEYLNQYFEGTFPNIKERRQKIEVNVFMHNFENLLYPLALLPEMRVILKYVTAEKGKYFKPSLFTSIEVISYEPEIEFNSANVVLGSNDWGRQTCLGSGNDIPTNIICWSTTISIKILQLRIKFKCEICKQEITENLINCCDQFEFSWDMSLTLLVRDAGGVCKVTTNNEEVLRVLLNKEMNEWSLFSKSMKTIRHFLFYDEMNDYNDDGDNDDKKVYNEDLDDAYCSDDPEYTEFLNSFIFILRAWNEAQIHHVDLKCRKMENKEKTNNFLPFWWCLEARRSFEPDLFQGS